MVKNVNESWIKRNAKKIKLIAVTTVTVISVGVSGLFIHNKVEENNRRQEYMQEYYSDDYNNETTTIINNSNTDSNQNVTEEVTIEQEIIVEDETTTNVSTETTSSDEQLPYNNVEVSFEDRMVSFCDIDTNSFVEQIRNYAVNYEGSEYFHVREALDRYNSMQEYDSTHELVYIQNNRVNESALRERIIANNTEFLNAQNGNKYSAFGSTYLDLAIDGIVNTINTQLVENEGIDVYQLDDNLDNLKVLNSNLTGNGQVIPDTSILTINQSLTVNFGGNNFFYYVACHETNHLIQVSSIKEKTEEGYASNNGISYVWDDLDVNALGFSWFSEGSAERLMLAENEVPSDLIAYQENVKSIDSLTLATIIRDDVDELTIPRLSLQPDLNRLFTIFNCQTEQEKEEIINMMFAFEIIYNKDTAFYRESGISDYKYDYRLNASIAQTLTKSFYYNLNERLVNGEESLSNIFELITLFETDMNRITKYYDSSRYEINKDFISMYARIQYSFFENIAKATGLTVDEVYSMYAEYYNNSKGLNETNNLDNDELDYFDDMFESRENIKPNENLVTFKQR